MGEVTVMCGQDNAAAGRLFLVVYVAGIKVSSKILPCPSEALRIPGEVRMVLVEKVAARRIVGWKASQPEALKSNTEKVECNFMIAL